jgi:hypothetical protein
MKKQTITHRGFFYSIILLLSFASNLQAAELNPVINLQVQDNELTWSPVEGATGYNIYLRGYYATVREGTSFTLSEVGTYSVTAFNDEGDFGPLRGADRITYDGGEDNRTFTNDIVYRTVRCFDLDAGESCEALCPDAAFTTTTGYFLSGAMGGACSSSDTVNINAQIAPKTYTCTVSAFTSRVEAQVACMVNFTQ